MSLMSILANTLAGSRSLARFQPRDPATGSAAVDNNGNPILSDAVPLALSNCAAASATTAAAIVVPYDAHRSFVHIFSRTTGNETVDLGPANVVAGAGIPITAGGGFSFLGAGAAGPIYAVTTVASSPLSFVEG